MKPLGYSQRSARISGRPAIPPFQERGVLWGLVWVSYWLTFCKRSNGLLTVLHYFFNTHIIGARERIKTEIMYDFFFFFFVRNDAYMLFLDVVPRTGSEVPPPCFLARAFLPHVKSSVQKKKTSATIEIWRYASFLAEMVSWMKGGLHLKSCRRRHMLGYRWGTQSAPCRSANFNWAGPRRVLTFVPS